MKKYLCLTTIPPRFKNLENIIDSLFNNVNDFEKIKIYIPQKYIRFQNNFSIPFYLERNPKVKIIICDKDYGPATKFIYPILFDSDIKDEDNIFILDDDNYKNAGWLDILQNKLTNNIDCVIQMKYGHILPQIHGVSGFCFNKKLLNTTNFYNFFTKLPIVLLFIDDDMLSYFLYINNIKICITNKKINRIYLNTLYGLINERSLLNRPSLRLYAVYYTYNKYNKKFPFKLLI